MFVIINRLITIILQRFFNFKKEILYKLFFQKMVHYFNFDICFKILYFISDLKIKNKDRRDKIDKTRNISQ